MSKTTTNGEAKTHRINGTYLFDNVKETTVSALGGVVDVVADTTSNTARAGEKISDDLTSLTKRMVVNTIKGFAEVSAVFGQAMLENARGGLQGVGTLSSDGGKLAKEAAVGAVKGASEVGTEFGSLAKKAAIDFIHGSAEVGSELGKVCKEGAIETIRGAGEVTAELGKVAHNNALGFIEGGTETTLTFEEGLVKAAHRLVTGYHEVRRQHEASLKEPREFTDQQPAKPKK